MATVIFSDISFGGKSAKKWLDDFQPMEIWAFATLIDRMTRPLAGHWVPIEHSMDSIVLIRIYSFIEIEIDTLP
jgi:hypothetical protein